MAPPSPAAAPPCSIVVIDDDRAIRQALASLLEDDGYAVAAKADGAEALAWLRAAPPGGPCLVLLDLRMPVMDGSAFLLELRATPELQHLRVCVLSADPSAAPPGADFVLQKPVSATALLRVVERLSRTIERPAPGAAPSSGAVPPRPS